MKYSIKIIAVVSCLIPLNVPAKYPVSKKHMYFIRQDENIDIQAQNAEVPFDQTDAYRAMMEAINQRPSKALNNCAAHCLYALMTAHVAFGSYFVATTFMGK